MPGVRLCLGIADEGDVFVGYWALKMNNGDAGWTPIEHVDGVWSAQLLDCGQA
ncbi:MAG: hypothetical protein R3F13_09880 [Prosthecobacter sp.]